MLRPNALSTRRRLQALRLWLAAAVWIAAPHALAQQETPASSAPRPFSAACVAQAQAIVRASAVEGGFPWAALKPVSGATATALVQSGVSRGSLDINSLISPPSTLTLYHLPSSGGLRREDGCPLHETYLGFRQGGFVPQPVRFYGPLRASGA